MFDETSLLDPAPPVPGTAERAKVAVRARQLKRNRRLAAAGGALGVVALVSLGAVAVTGGGSSAPGTDRVQVAGAFAEREAVATTVPAPATTDVAPAADTNAGSTGNAAGAAGNPAQPAVATPAVVATFTVSGTVSGVPDGVTGTVRLVGVGDTSGSYSVALGAGGAFSLGGVPAGTYNAEYSWSNADGSASQAGIVRNVAISGDLTVTFPA